MQKQLQIANILPLGSNKLPSIFSNVLNAYFHMFVLLSNSPTFPSKSSNSGYFSFQNSNTSYHYIYFKNNQNQVPLFDSKIYNDFKSHCSSFFSEDFIYPSFTPSLFNMIRSCQTLTLYYYSFLTNLLLNRSVSK